MLRDMLSVDGDADAAVEARIRIGWNKFRQLDQRPLNGRCCCCCCDNTTTLITCCELVKGWLLCATLSQYRQLDIPVI